LKVTLHLRRIRMIGERKIAITLATFLSGVLIGCAAPNMATMTDSNLIARHQYLSSQLEYQNSSLAWVDYISSMPQTTNPSAGLAWSMQQAMKESRFDAMKNEKRQIELELNKRGVPIYR
jgi:hypothetical protein